jgi:Flp pilus assembly protein TadD/2-polyprenyl-3-methyl-5-hydroxy-6-metoxy-1,4-benzoquinol methylase
VGLRYIRGAIAMPHSHEPQPQDINALVALFSQARFVEAQALARKLTERFPGYGFFWKALGAVLMQTGQSAQAIAPLQQAANLLPQDPEAHCNLGAALRTAGRADEAVACYQRALKINPGFAQAHGNLGNAYRDAGRLEEAVASYQRALATHPQSVDLLIGMGTALAELGRPQPAAQALERALAVQPDNAEALDVLAYLLIAHGQHADALPLVQRSLRAADRQQAMQLFVDCVKYVQWIDDEGRDDAPMRGLLQRALTEAWGRPNDLVRAGMDLARHGSALTACKKNGVLVWPERLPSEPSLSSDTLLCTVLQAAQICDAEVERFLTQARCALLERVMQPSGAQDAAESEFFAALACQCFVNEYVFAMTPQEADTAATLRDRVVYALGHGATVTALEVLAVASYFALGTLAGSARLLSRDWPLAVQAVLQQQVQEPAQEAALRSDIPQWTAIENAVSVEVRQQYEESPYPRWVRLPGYASVLNVNQTLGRLFQRSAFVQLANAEAPEILIAGCGTGQQPIDTALRFAGARVTAIDLSVSSLCYARRKATEMGLTSIAFAQADLLQLGALDRRFDVIESSGVLHHLEDPQRGWRVLLGLLRPGGVMKLGLYSEMARRHIVRIRELIAVHGYPATADGIRQCRRALLQ